MTTGLVTSVQYVPRGAELVSAAAVSATTLTVESGEDFDDAGGDLELNGVRYEYESCDIDTGVITLTSAVTVAGAVDDFVYSVAGGQREVDHVAEVSVGDGDDIEVYIPYAERALWPEGVYDDGVPVTLTPDLERIASVPGRTPIVDSDFVTYEGRTVDGPVITGGYLATTLSSGYRVIINGSQIAMVSADGTVVRSVIDPTGYLSIDPIVSSGSIHGDDVYVDSVPTSASAANCRMNNDGRLVQSTSVRAAKGSIRDLKLEPADVLKIRPRTWKSKLPGEKGEPGVGVIAEELEDIGLGVFCEYRDGVLTGVQYERLVVALLPVLRDQEARIAALEKRAK